MSSETPVSIPCDACGQPIEGAAIWHGLSKYHTWCWHAQQREKHLPGLDEPQQDPRLA
jgi:hypothetical protein